AGSGDPATTDDDVPLVKHCSLTRSNGALWLVKRSQNFIFADALKQCARRLVPVTNLHFDANRSRELLHCNPIHLSCLQSTREKLVSFPDDHLAICSIDLEHIQRRAGCDTQALPLANCEVV